MTYKRRVLLAALAATCGLATLLLAAGTARAETRRVLVFRLTGAIPAGSGAREKVLTRLTEVVARSAGLTGAEVTIGQVSFDDASALAGCATPDPACLAQIAQVLHVDHVVFGDVQPSADGAQLEVSLTAYVNGQVTQKSITLPAGDLETMVQQLARKAPTLFVGSSPAEPAPEPEPEPTPAPEPPPVAEPPPAPRTVAVPPPHDTGFQGARVSGGSWVLAGGGLVLLGSGVVLSVMAQSKQDEIDAAPIASVEDFEHLQDLEEQGERLSLVGNGLLIGGGAVLLAGAAIILYQGYSGPDPDPQPRVSFHPSLLPGGAGLTFEVSLP